MKCNRFRDYEQGKIEAEEFALHSRDCSVCREEMALDARLKEGTQVLREPVSAPHLWTRIEAGLREEKKRTEARRPHRTPVIWTLFRNPGFAAAATLILVGVSLILLFSVRGSTPSKGHLTQKALTRIESREHEYISAIEELEKNVRPKLADMDFEMMALYRERLETIDAQIERCRTALELNPANAHIRRYMLAALQDKKTTLVQIQDYQ
ncbi:MAG: anti-sigma factor [Candidatus Aminicenantes bacterium]|nr:anti-sigma factor [Candidatus Aminicenantes bacterium]